MEPTIAGFLVEGLLDGLVSVGCDPDVLRRKAGLPAGRRFRWLPYRALDDLMEAGLELTGDDNLGLHLAGCILPETGGPIGLLLLACPDFAAALGRVIRFQRLLCSVERMRLIEGPDGVCMDIRVPDPHRPAGRQVVEWMMADMRCVSETLLGYRLVPREVRFAHPEPAGSAEHEAWFDAPVVWDAEANQGHLALSDWRAPIRSASETFRGIFERQVLEHVRALPDATAASRVRDALREALPHVPTVQEVAKRLRIAPRTLQRQLRQEGTSLSAELDEVRRAEAESLLSSGVDIAEVSWRLGYSAPRAFHRAFRRWHGTTPEAWRSP